ncbi:protein D2 [Bemisia tabaci]|uniref:protein D2 n=1 Tax=Bemisia tabaci TaxID=7038 RepID=UPI003B27DC1F
MPDPNNSTQREYQCWVVVNIPGIHVDHGQVLTDYIPPPTPTAHGSQRYIFLVYIQPKGNMSFSQDYLPPVPNDMARQTFSTAEFTKNHAYGVPFAGNMVPNKLGIIQQLLSGNASDPDFFKVFAFCTV